MYTVEQKGFVCGNMKVHPQIQNKNQQRGFKTKSKGTNEQQSTKPKSRDGPFSLLATSLRHQTTEFFNNSTLHGVRYIAEKERPFCEKWVSLNANIYLYVIIPIHINVIF